MKDSTTKNKHRKYTLIAIVFTVAIWHVVAVIVNRSILVPSPYETFVALVEILCDASFFIIVGHTLKRMLIGFGVFSRHVSKCRARDKRS